MKNLYKTFTAAMIGIMITASAMAQPLVHPGLLHTAADLDRMRDKVAAGAQPWTSSWNILAANSHSSLTRPISTVPSIIYRGFDGTHPENYALLFRDAASAYATALRWKISGDNAYADKSIQILNAWAAGLQTISGTSDRYLLAGIQGYQLANAAEIMRTYSGWNATDFNNFKNWMLNVFYPMNRDFLLNHNGSCISHYWANWDLCNMASMLGIGVLCDRRDIYDEAVNYFKTGAGNGAIDKLVPFVYGDLGQWQESGRDQGHTVLGVTLAGSFCEMAWNQGEDLYGYDNNRLLKGFEYIAKYNLGYEVPYTTYSNCDGIIQTIVSSDGRGEVRPVWEIVYNHYVNRKGLSAPYITQFAQRVRPEGGGGNYGPNSGGYDQLGYGTLTFSLETPVRPNNQTISFPSIPVQEFGAPDFSAGAVASSGLPVAYSSSNPNVASINTDGTIKVKQPGTTIIYAQQLGNVLYNEAPVAQQTLTVNKIPGTNDGTWSNTSGTVSTTISSTSGSAELRWPGQNFVVGDHVRLTGTVPGGFIANTSYTVVAVNAAENKIQLSARPGGLAIVATTTIANGTGMRFQKWLAASNWTGGVVARGINSTANFGSTSFANIGGVTLDSNIVIGILNYAANGTSELHLASGEAGGQLSFETVAGMPALNMINTGARKLFLGNAINNSRVPLKIAGTQGLKITTPIYGNSSSFAGLRIQAAMDWSNFSGPFILAQGTIEIHNTTNSPTAADNVILPQQRLVMATDNTAVLIFTGAGNVASKQTVGALDGTDAAYILARTAVTNGVSTLVVGVDNQNGEYAGTIGMGPVDVAGDKGRVRLEKTGSGTQVISGTIKNGTTVISGTPMYSTVGVSNGKLVLEGANEYQGTTTVTGGSLVINGSGISPVSVQAGVLSGAGSINGALAVSAGATLAPGNGIGIFTNLSSTILEQDAICQLEFSSSTVTFDKFVTNGITINNAQLSLVDLNASVFIASGGSYTIIDNTGEAPVTGQFAGLSEGAVLSNGENLFTISYTGGTGNDVVLTVVPANLLVQYMDGDNGQTTNNTGKPYLKIMNDGIYNLPYNELTIRYWITPENYSGLNTWIDYAQLGNKVKIKYVPLAAPRNGATGYIEFSFDAAAGLLTAGTNSDVIQSRFANTDWSAQDETTDYSYKTNTFYSVDSAITLYRNGQLIWGIEPEEIAPLILVKAYSESKSSGANAISSYLKIANEGNTPVAYSDIAVRYWFTSEGSAPLNFWNDYSKLGNNNINGSFTRLNPSLPGADAYLELKFGANLGSLHPWSNSGNVQYRITKSDWSAFNQADDHSYKLPAPFNENAQITVYYQGQLIWGEEPADRLLASRQTALNIKNEEKLLLQDVLIYPNPVSSGLFIRVDKLGNNASAEIFAANGTMVRVIRIGSVLQEVKLNGLPTGVYYVKVNNGGKTITKMIVKK